MSNRYSRHQSVVSREADGHIDEDHWLKQFEKNLHKSAVQSRKVDQSLFDQINGIMNTKSKYTSVSAAVEDMMQRSGLSSHLKNINKVSEESVTSKTADQSESNLIIKKIEALKAAADLHKSVKEVKDVKDAPLPAIIQEVPSILKTIENYIESTKGNSNLFSTLQKIQSIHKNDVSDSNDSAWEDKDLLKLINDKILAKKLEHSHSEQNSNLGKLDTDFGNDNDANTDMFKGLMPAKI